MKPENYERYKTRIAGFEVEITTYRLGGRYFCRVDNVDPGATIARGNGETLEQARDAAFDSAISMLHSKRPS